jgi:uncharacterized lipoprotein YajG
MSKLFMLVGVLFLGACAAKEEAVQGEVAVDSAAVVDSTKIDTDSIKSAEVKPAVEGEAAK